MVLPPKKVAAIHDLSGFGRCALTVIIPALSSMSVQVCPVPTAILSTHTGGFSGFTFHDFTDSMPGYISHWKSLGLSFDAVYSGFLGSPEQIEIVASFIDDFGTSSALVMVDPVMGDDGHMYSTYTEEMCFLMKRLVAKADIITPNLTEAALLLEIDYSSRPDVTAVKKWLVALCEMGPGVSVITGVPSEGKMKNFAYDSRSNEFWVADCDIFDVRYPGTGDIFSSVLLGSLLGGSPLPNAISTATGFVAECISATARNNTPVRDGVMLECVLHLLRGGICDSEFEKI